MISTFEQITSKLVESKYYSILDANSGFYQVKLDEESANSWTVGTLFGRCNIMRLPYGIQCAPEAFSDKFCSILNKDRVVIYIDDILVHGRTKNVHDQRLKQVFNIAKMRGVTLNLNKCKFA